MSIYNIWKSEVKMPIAAEIKRVKAEYSAIKPFEPEKDGYIFLHGVALALFKGRMYCSWAHNKVRENSDDEEVNFAYSDDNGKTWSECIKGNLRPQEDLAVSHGAFLACEEKLYFFAPQFKGLTGEEFMKMSAYIFDEAEQRFCYAGVALEDRFWPMCEPVLMENGSYLMAGIYVAENYHSPNNTAAVAISHGSDVLHWDMVKLQRAEDVRVWGECTVTVEGSHCKMYCREHSRKMIALYSESHDYGKTWCPLDKTNLPMIDSKPYGGTLSDDRRYLICSCAKDIADRNPLTIAIAEKGEAEFSKIFIIDEGMTLSYPYAIEQQGKLYIAYSAATERFNRNSAKLAIVDIKDLS